MGYSKPTEVTRSYLESSPLPTHGKSYTVVSHKEVIDNTLNLLNASGFAITNEIYRSNMRANVAQGIYYLRPLNPIDKTILDEEELGMMFSWTNSYDKSTRFQCAIGAYVKVCSNGMVAGDMMNYSRKHTGSANMDIKNHIASQIKNAEKYYARIIKDKDTLKTIDMCKKTQSELVGRLFIDEDILDSQQVSCIKKEMEKPSFNYGVANDSAWAFYNHVTHALKKAHPRDWLADQQNFHDFMTAECISNLNKFIRDLTEYDLNTDNTDLNIDMTDTDLAIQIDEDVTEKRLIQDIYMGR